ncbi:MAG TPA: class I SAM-dependent methyltransferase [Candidatus Eisenbacteria bacterium]|jgi:hypothetical protein|nr:class I SAM-dependent methyltransferase [Candidatus Eisenbacteria bacterium]
MRTLLARALRRIALNLSPSSNQIEVRDSYLKFLLYANAGMLNTGNLYLMEYAVSHLPTDAPILEIGSFCGLSANILSYFKQKHRVRNRLVTCDPWVFEETERGQELVGDSGLPFADYMAFARDSFLRSTETFSRRDLPYTIQSSSDTFFAAWKEKQSLLDVRGREIALGGAISFCYIDGNHTYEGVKRDFLNCDSFLENKGFVLFDDSSVPEFGVGKLMPEVLQTGRYKLIGKNPNHLFQKLT